MSLIPFFWWESVIHSRVMKPLFAIIALVPFLGVVSCGKRETKTLPTAEEQSGKPVAATVDESAHATAAPATVSPPPSSLAEVMTDWHKTLDSPKKLAALVKHYQETQGVSAAEAWMHFHEEATRGKTEREERHVGMMFSQSIVMANEDPASVMKDLPSGLLRSACIATVRGSDVPLDKLEAIHGAMPESQDRAAVRDTYTSKAFQKDGLDSSLRFMDSLETEKEKKEAVKNLAETLRSMNAIASNATFASLPNAPKAASAEDVKKLLAYAKERGMENEVKVLTEAR